MSNTSDYTTLLHFYIDLAGGALEDARLDGEVLLETFDLEQAHATCSRK